MHSRVSISGGGRVWLAAGCGTRGGGIRQKSGMYHSMLWYWSLCEKIEVEWGRVGLLRH